MIKSRQDFKNPCLYERLVVMFDIHEKGTNFPTSVFDPSEYVQVDFYAAERPPPAEKKRPNPTQS
jgi:hypothetical protein